MKHSKDKVKNKKSNKVSKKTPYKNALKELGLNSIQSGIGEGAILLSSAGGGALGHKYYYKKVYPKWQQTYRLNQKLLKKLQDVDNVKAELQYLYRPYAELDKTFPQRKPITNPSKLLTTKQPFNPKISSSLNNRWGTVFRRLSSVQKKMKYLEPPTKDMLGFVNSGKAYRRLITTGGLAGVVGGGALTYIAGNLLRKRHPLYIPDKPTFKKDYPLGRVIQNIKSIRSKKNKKTKKKKK